MSCNATRASYRASEPRRLLSEQGCLAGRSGLGTRTTPAFTIVSIDHMRPFRRAMVPTTSAVRATKLILDDEVRYIRRPYRLGVSLSGRPARVA